MSRRGKVWAVVAAVLVMLTVAAAVLVPVPFVARSPGPVFDILGSIDDKKVLEIQGAESFPTTGVLDMTTVAETGGSAGPMNVGTALVGLFLPDTSVLPDENADEPGSRAADEAIFDASQSQALGAAARYLDRPVTSQVVILEVVPGSAAEGNLRAGDVVLALDGARVTDRKQIVDAVGGEPAGTAFRFTVRRDGKKQEVEVTSRPDPAAEPGGPDRALVGILADNRYRSDFTVTVNLDGIGGPSAGLMLSVGMVDRLTPGDMLAGRRVAGTGTIDGDGLVGPIGGIDKKMIAAQQAGAELFIAPAENCVDVVASQPDGLQVVPVKDLSGAMTALADWQAERPLRGCPRTGDE